MNGAIFYSSRYGSTAQYAHWIAEATDLPVFDVKNHKADPASYDFLVVGSPIIYHKVSIRKWVKRHWSRIANKPIIFFTVSGAPAGAKLDGWIADSLPESLIANMNHVALRGRSDPKEHNLFDRLMLIIGSMKNPDPVASKEELEGFDFMDKTSIAPIPKLVQQIQSGSVTESPVAATASQMNRLADASTS